MSLHPTLSEECIQYSVKKYFKEGLQATSGIPVYFSYVYMNPNNKIADIPYPTWIRFHFDGTGYVGGLSEQRLNAYVFSRGIKEEVSAGKLLAQTRDLLTEYLVNVDPNGNGIRSIPLVDLQNIRHSSMVVTFDTPSNEEMADDNTLYRLIPIILKFATI